MKPLITKSMVFLYYYADNSCNSPICHINGDFTVTMGNVKPMKEYLLLFGVNKCPVWS